MSSFLAPGFPSNVSSLLSGELPLVFLAQQACCWIPAFFSVHLHSSGLGMLLQHFFHCFMNFVPLLGSVVFEEKSELRLGV